MLSGGYVRREHLHHKVVIQIISGLSTKKVDEIEFGLLSPDEIRKMSVTQIVVADTYDEDGYPIENSTDFLAV